MTQANGGAGLVVVLATRSGRAIHVHLDVLVADLDLDRVIHDRIDEDGGERSVASALRIERGDADESVNAALCLEISERVLAAKLERGGLDARFLALQAVEKFDPEALLLPPAAVHAQEHLRPVLRFRSSRTGVDGHDRIPV